MTSTGDNNLSEIYSETQVKHKKKKKKKNKSKQKKNNYFTFLYLFAIVFICALLGVSYIIKSFSPEVDVTIGNNDSYTLNYSDVDVEVKPIDERLKWIQMEDELPTVSVKVSGKNDKTDKLNKDVSGDKTEQIVQDKKQDKTEKQKTVVKQEKESKNLKDESTLKPALKLSDEIKKQKDDFKNIPPKDVIQTEKNSITRVYLGNYKTREEAEEIQEKIRVIEPSIEPFVKTVNDHFIVQLGSFSDSERASSLASKLKAQGYSPKVNHDK